MDVFSGPHQQENLTEVYSISSGVMVVAYFFAGICYDQYGPRNCVVISTVLCSFFMVLMALSISRPEYNYALFIAYPAVTLFGQMNTFGIFAWLWLLPNHQNTVNALSMAVPALSDSMVLLIVLAHDQYKVSLTCAFLFLAAFSFISTGVYVYILPSKEENLMHAEWITSTVSQENCSTRIGGDYASLGDTRLLHSPVEEGELSEGEEGELSEGEEGELSEGEEGELSEGEARDGELKEEKNALASIIENVRDSMTVMFYMFPVANALHMACLMSLYLLIMSLIINQYYWFMALHGGEEANDLVNMFAIIYGFGGAASAVGFGLLMDRIDFSQTILLLNMTALALIVSVMMPSFSAQIVGEGLVTLVINVFGIMAGRWVTLYAPPELFGTLVGIQMATLGIGQITLIPLINDLAAVSFPGGSHGAHESNDTDLSRYRVQFCGYFVLSMLSGIPMYCYYIRHPPPLPGSVQMAHVRKTQRAKREEHAAAAALNV